MARRRRYDNELLTDRSGVGYSQPALDALNAGKYDQLTGRDPKYRTSSEQVKQSKELPVLEGIKMQPTTSNNDWQSSFGRRNNVDTMGVRQKYAQRIDYEPIGKALSQKDADLIYSGAFRMLNNNRSAADVANEMRTEGITQNYTRNKDWEKEYGRSLESLLEEYANNDAAMSRHFKQTGEKGGKLGKTLGAIGINAYIKPVMGARNLVNNTIIPDSTKTKNVNKASQLLSEMTQSAKDSTTKNSSDAAKWLYDQGTGIGERLARDLTPFGYVLNGLGTAEDVRQNLEDQGITGREAAAYSFARGTMDAIVSKIARGLGAKETGNWVARAGKSFGKHGVLGAGEQTIAEAVDRLILGDKGTYETEVKNYMAQGLSEEEARDRAWDNGLIRIAGQGLTRGVVGAATSIGSDIVKGVNNKLRDLAYRAYMNRYVVDPDDPIFDEPIIDLDDLNEYFSGNDNLIEGQAVPRLTGTVESPSALPGGNLPALPDNIYPIKMPGTNGVINLTGTGAPIQLPDLTAKALNKTAALRANDGTIRSKAVLPSMISKKTAKTDVDEYIQALAGDKIDSINAIKERINSSDFKPITFTTKSGDTHIIHKSTRPNTKWQVSTISDTGEPLGHSDIKNDEDLLKKLVDIKGNIENLNLNGETPYILNPEKNTTTFGEMIANPSAYTKEDFDRAIRTWDHNANPEESSLEDIIEFMSENIANDPGLADMSVVMPPKTSTSAPVQMQEVAPISAPEGIQVYRGYNRSDSPLERNLAGQKTIYDVLGKENPNKVDMLPLEYYTDSFDDATNYANQDKALYDIMQQRGVDYETMTGRKPEFNGHVESHTINPQNVLDLSELGEQTSVDAIYNYLSRITGKTPSEIDDILRFGGMEQDSNGNIIDVPAYNVLRNADQNEGAFGTRFIDFMRNNGYDAVKYKESGANHYALLNDKTSAPKQDQSNWTGLKAQNANRGYKSAHVDPEGKIYLPEEYAEDYYHSGSRGNKNRKIAADSGKKIIVKDQDELRQFLFGDSSDYANVVAYGKVSDDLAQRVYDVNNKFKIKNYFLEAEKGYDTHAEKHMEPKEPGDLPMSEDEIIDALEHINEAKVIYAKRYGDENKIKLALDKPDGRIYMIEMASKSSGALKFSDGWKNSPEKVRAREQKKNSPSPAGDYEVTPNSVRNGTALSNNNVPQVKGDVNQSAGYWNRILGDDAFLAEEAQKQGVEPNELRKWAKKNLGYGDDDDINPPSGGNVPPKGGNGGGSQRERGMSQHMRGEGKMDVDIPEEVKDDFINDPDMYEALSNKATKEKALKIYNEHPDDREAVFRSMLTQYDPAALPLGQMIAKNYSAQGNHAMAAQIFRDMGERLTKAGQFSQASILTMLKNDPLTAQEYAQRSIDKLNQQGKKEFGKKWKDLELTEEEQDAFEDIEPGDEEALAELYDQIGQRLGREYPSTMMEKLLEGRKIAMLFNVRTISRNFFANPPTLGMRYMADRVEALGQTVANIIDPTFEKTQSMSTGGVGKKLAKEFVKTQRYQNLVNGVDEKHTVPDLKSEIVHHKQMYKGTAAEKFIDRWSGNAFNSISDALYEAGKIKSNPHIEGGIQALNKKAFKKDDVQSILETIRNTTYKLLDVTDSPFVKKNFSQRLASYINAQGIKKLEDIPDAAVDLAWNEALKATYKDDSWMVKVLSGIKKSTEKIPVIGKPLSQGLIPFVQAPGNIAARMVDYSPINLTKGVAQIIKGATKKDHNTIRKGIEAAAKGLTGSALALLGMKLYKSGILTGDYSQDNKEKSFQQRNGFKPWSLHVGDKYFTFNWMQPFAQTIMAGILAQQAIDNADQFDSDVLRHFGIEGSTAGKVIGSAYQSGKAAINSWFDESPLGDFTKLFSGSYYDRDIAQNVVDVGEDFASAMYPAGGNALAKTVDTTKRNTKDPSNRFSTFLNEQMAKVPFVSEKLPAAYDTWGEEIKNADSHGEAFFQRFAYPGEYSSDSSDPLDVEVQRLFKSTNDNRAFPFYAANKVDGKTLNNKEKSEYQKDMGQRSKQLAQAFVNSDRYKNMDDANRVETLNSLYYTSKAITERDVFGKPVADSSPYKSLIKAYDDAKGGEKGVKAVIDMIGAKSSVKEANISATSNLAKDIEKAAKAGNDKKVEEMTEAAKSVEDLGFTKVGPKETYIKAKSVDSSLSLEDFGKTYKEIDTNGNQGITQKEMVDYLNKNNVPEVKGLTMWDMYAPKGKKVPYVKKDGSWGAH